MAFFNYNENSNKGLIFNEFNQFHCNTKNIPIFTYTKQVIAAEGEQKASHALKQAAEVIQESPSALQVSTKLYVSTYYLTLIFMLIIIF